MCNQGNAMGFDTEPTAYKKTILSDLQGAWECFLEAVIKDESLQQKPAIILHIHEAMSWESVRDLKCMAKLLLLIRNIVLQSEAGKEVVFWLDEVDRIFQSIISEIKKGIKI